MLLFVIGPIIASAVLTFFEWDLLTDPKFVWTCQIQCYDKKTTDAGDVMANTHIVRAVRQPLTWLVILAFALVAMLAFESTGSSHAPSAVPLSTVAKQDKPAKPANDDKHKHCKDNNGKDNPKNKHCRGISGT